KDREQPVPLPDRLHARQDGIVLVQEELAEVSEVNGTIEMLWGTPGTRNPGMVQLNLPGEGQRSIAEDARTGSERLSVDDRNRPLFQGLMRNYLAEHPLPTNLCQQRDSFITINA